MALLGRFALGGKMLEKHMTLTCVVVEQSGERITKLEELQDIDELYVEEVRSFIIFQPAASL